MTSDPAGPPGQVTGGPRGEVSPGPRGDVSAGPPGQAPAGPPEPLFPAHRSRGDEEAVAGLAEALALYGSGVTLVMVADGRDDIGTTVSAFCPVSLSPPLILVSLIAESYPAEVLGRVDRFAVVFLAAGQRALAGRFAVAGRPGARLLLDGIPHQRGDLSGALIPGGGLAALECEITQRVPAGDHMLAVARVLAVPYVAGSGEPLIRFAGRYPSVR